MDWFSMMCTSSALFHSFVSFAGAYIDARYSTQVTVDPPEILAHKVEAIRQINLELSKDELSDGLLLAIMQMARLRDETDSKKQESIELNRTSPFRLPPMLLQWQERQLTNFALDHAHLEGVRAIVNLKGGINGIKTPLVAKTLSQ
jgi:hypothetical protein